MGQTRHASTAWDCRIEDGVLWYEDCPQMHVDSEDFWLEIDSQYVVRVISVDYSPQLRVWYPDAELIESVDMEFTLRQERRKNGMFWYAYRRVHGKLHKVYVGKSDQITTRKLVELGRKLPNK